MTLENSDPSSLLSQDAEELLNVGPKDLEYILKVNNLTLEAFNDMVTNVRQWMEKQPHLPNDIIKTGQIRGFLIFVGFSVEKAKNGLDNFLAVRIAEPDILCQRDPLDPIQEEYLKRGHAIQMPKKTPEDHRVVVLRVVDQVKNCSVTAILKSIFMCLEYRLWNDVSSGDRWIIDLKDISFHEVKQVTPVLLSNLIFIIKNVLGAKLKSVHIINTPPVAAALVNIFKMMIKSKIAARVFIAKEEDIINLFPKECLPVEYGGEGGSCQDIADKWTKAIQSKQWREYFLEQNSVLPDLSKKDKSSLMDDNIFGVDGSFRKLCVD